MVDQKRCDERHGWVKWLFRLLFGLVGVGAAALFTVGGWSIHAGYAAQKKAMAVENKLVTHEAVQIKTEQHRDETLDRIETMVKDLHAREPP